MSQSKVKWWRRGDKNDAADKYIDADDFDAVTAGNDLDDDDDDDDNNDQGDDASNNNT